MGCPIHLVTRPALTANEKTGSEVACLGFHYHEDRYLLAGRRLIGGDSPFFAVTNAPRVVTISATRLGGLRIFAEIATSANARVPLGFLRLFAGRHIHIRSRRNIRRGAP